MPVVSRACFYILLCESRVDCRGFCEFEESTRGSICAGPVEQCRLTVGTENGGPFQDLRAQDCHILSPSLVIWDQRMFMRPRFSK